MFDNITYEKVDGKFVKTVTYVGVVENVENEIVAIQTQIADISAGVGATPEEQVAIDALLESYNQNLLILQN